MSNQIKQEELINEYVNRWFLAEDGDSEALKESSKAEMRRQMKAIVDGEVTSVLDELERQKRRADECTEDTYVVKSRAIQSIRSRYEG